MIERLHRASRGIPRLVNLVCHKSLMAAYGSGDLAVKRSHLQRAANDTEDVIPRTSHWLLALVSGLVSFIALTGAGLLYAGGL